MGYYYSGGYYDGGDPRPSRAISSGYRPSKDYLEKHPPPTRDHESPYHRPEPSGHESPYHQPKPTGHESPYRKPDPEPAVHESAYGRPHQPDPSLHESPYRRPESVHESSYQ